MRESENASESESPIFYPHFLGNSTQLNERMNEYEKKNIRGAFTTIWLIFLGLFHRQALLFNL